MVIRYAFPDNVHDARNTRPCRKCGEVKSVTEFAWRKDTQNYASRCYECEAVRHAGYRRRTHKPSKRWTKALDDLLRNCIIQGMTPDEAAAAVGRTRHAVFARRSTQSMPHFPSFLPTARRTVWLPDRIAKLKTLRDASMSFTQCAAILGTTRNSIAGGTRYLREVRP